MVKMLQVNDVSIHKCMYGLMGLVLSPPIIFVDGSN